MPIRPEEKHRYPKDWKQIVQRIGLRSRGRCECTGECGDDHRGRCNLLNGSWGWRDRFGKFHRVNKRALLEADTSGTLRPPFDLQAMTNGCPVVLRIIRIVLTVAHLDHTPENCDDRNLKHWCQRCHLLYDKQHHHATRRSGRAARDLFQEQT